MDLGLMNLNARFGERLFIEKSSISFCLMTDKDRKQTEATTDQKSLLLLLISNFTITLKW